MNQQKYKIDVILNLLDHVFIKLGLFLKMININRLILITIHFSNHHNS